MSVSTAAASAPPNSVARSLANLEAAASTTRVLNLTEVGREWGAAAAWREQPLFRAWALNNAMLIKHRPGGDSAVTTRIHLAGIGGVPGPVIVLGRSGWREELARGCAADEGPAFHADLAVLQALDELPAFDPFLIREQLGRLGRSVAACYVPTSADEVEAVRAFIINEVAKLVMLAIGARRVEQTARLVGAIMSAQDDPRLEPLRLTFGLEPDAFREGVFAWKGFLYYKRQLAQLKSPVNIASAELGRLVLLDPCPPLISKYFGAGQERIRRALSQDLAAAAQLLAVYDKAFTDLTEQGDPRTFREFLAAAPALFFRLGERMGALSHFAAYWRRRYPVGIKVEATGADACELLRDIDVGLGDWPEGENAAAA
jgi:hypothetical protein